HHRPVRTTPAAGAHHPKRHRAAHAPVHDTAGCPPAVGPSSGPRGRRGPRACGWWGWGAATDAHHAHGVVEVHHAVAAGHLLRRMEGSGLLCGNRRRRRSPGGDLHAVAPHHALGRE
ncbi:unnamed protein product, partial [Ectocarpus sp. 12 AP-2014]